MQTQWDESLRAEFVDWICTANPVKWLNAHSEEIKVDLEIRRVLHRCLMESVADDDLSEKLKAAVNKDFDEVVLITVGFVDVTIGRLLMSDPDFAKILKRLANSLHPVDISNSSSEATRLVLAEYFRRYLQAWLALPEADRHDAAGKLLDLAAPSVLAELADATWNQLSDLGKIAASRQTLTAIPMVTYVLNGAEASIKKHIASIDSSAADALAARLKSIGPRGFRNLLEARTRDQLDMIQVNGALLGALLGALVGGVSIFLH